MANYQSPCAASWRAEKKNEQTSGHEIRPGGGRQKKKSPGRTREQICTRYCSNKHTLVHSLVAQTETVKTVCVALNVLMTK